MSIPESEHPVTTTRMQVLLLEFLRDHDAECPACGYNVRGLSRPVCPECKQQLVLSVGVYRLQMAWLFTALAPGFFSGIAAFFVLIPIIARYIVGDGRHEPVIIALDIFGWCSLTFAIILASRWRIAFLTQSRKRQRWIAIIIWLIHIAALGAFILAARLYL